MRKVELSRWEKAFEFLDQGLSPEAAAKRARIAPSTMYRFMSGNQSSSGLEAASLLGRTVIGGKDVPLPLSEEATKAMADFAYFRRRYLGRRSTPWQERAGYEVLRSIETEDREYVVINCPPGSGKSTLFTHDIPCWLIARDRTIRIMIGSRTERQARMYVGRIKKTLEREAPLLADPEALARGEAFDAEATMQGDFTAFRPTTRGDLWRSEALTVRQLSGQALDDKEATVSAWGQDSGFLGGRYDFVMWDDLVDKKNTKTAEGLEGLIEWWDTEAESRLEPRGTLVLQGQRIAHDDLYRHALDKQVDEGGDPKFRHVVYQAHDESKCVENHEGPNVEAWPNGCLLDPVRLPWKALRSIKHNSPRTFEVMYQQKDGDSVDGLVEPEWIEGGADSSGYVAPGCLDKMRTVGEVPGDVEGGWSFITIDPSPTEWWGVIWWLYDPATEKRHIIDLWRRKMNPEQFLSLDLDTGEFSGLILDTYQTSLDINIPLTDVIVEINAAQRWLLAQPHIQKWSQVSGVRFSPHTTGYNKADPKFGVESTGDIYRQGLIRIPHSTPSARMKTQPLIDELLRYPDSKTTDMVMSQWFAHLAVNNMFAPKRQGQYRQYRPAYLRNARRGLPEMTGVG
jgi:hypothetical protein